MVWYRLRASEPQQQTPIQVFSENPPGGDLLITCVRCTNKKARNSIRKIDNLITHFILY